MIQRASRDTPAAAIEQNDEYDNTAEGNDTQYDFLALSPWANSPIHDILNEAIAVKTIDKIKILAGFIAGWSIRKMRQRTLESALTFSMSTRNIFSHLVCAWPFSCVCACVCTCRCVCVWVTRSVLRNDNLRSFASEIQF